jgi:CRISPR-associated protein Csm5
MVTTEICSIPKPTPRDTARIRLTSPLLRIGGNVSTLNPYEYVQDSDRVYLPDENALAKALYSRGKLNDFIGAIERRESIAPLLKQVFGEDWKSVRDREENLIFPPQKISNNLANGKVTDLRPAIRNGSGQLYIPGSSIKGAIRTAIAYYLLKNEDRYNTPVRVSAIEEQLREKLTSGDLKRKAKFIDDEFMNDLFVYYDLRYQGHISRAKTGPNTDFLRALQVSDSPPVTPIKIKTKNDKITTYNVPITAEFVVSSHFEDDRAKYRASIYAEAIANVRTEFTLSLDHEMLKWFRHRQGMEIPFSSIGELIAICQDFAQEQWDGEYDYWDRVKNNRDKGQNLDFDLVREFYEDENCPYQLRIGWGSGLGGTTIDWLLNDELRSQIRDTCGIKAPNFEAPKSRRSVRDKSGKLRHTPGWVKFKVI